MNRKVWISGVAIVLGSVLMLSLAWGLQHAALANPPLLGKTAPRLAIQTSTGDRVKVWELQGKPVVLNFWASWCGPCQQETPLLASWYKQEHGRIALVGLDENDTTSKALAFAHAKGVTYTLGFDPQLTVTGPYDVDGLPQTFFLNAQHRIVEHVLGAMTKADLAQGVTLMNTPGTPSEKTVEPS